jgi:hypothetical protein
LGSAIFANVVQFHYELLSASFITGRFEIFV